MGQSGTYEGPVAAMLRIGGKYDTNVEVAYDDLQDSSDEKEDLAGVVSLVAGFQPQTAGNLGFRADYGVYADFFQDLNEYNVFEQMISLEPFLKTGPFVCSLPLRYTLAVEDEASDYHRLSLAPTLNYTLPGGRQALEVYGLVSRISDEDDYEVDEDAVSAGAGIAFMLFSGDRSYVRLSGEYQNTVYDAEVRDYGAGGGTDERSDNILTASLAVNRQLLPALDVYGVYSYIDTRSNCDIYEYDRHIVEAGVAINF